MCSREEGPGQTGQPCPELTGSNRLELGNMEAGSFSLTAVGFMMISTVLPASASTPGGSGRSGAEPMVLKSLLLGPGTVEAGNPGMPRMGNDLWQDWSKSYGHT